MLRAVINRQILEASTVRKAFLGVVVAVCVMNLAGPVSVGGQTSRWYLVEDIGTFGTSYTEGFAINDNGDIAGYAQMPGSPSGFATDPGYAGGGCKQTAGSVRAQPFSFIPVSAGYFF